MSSMIIVPWAMLDLTLKQILARSLKAVIDQPQLTQAFFSSSVSRVEDKTSKTIGILYF